MNGNSTDAAATSAPAMAQEAVLVRSEDLEGKCRPVKGCVVRFCVA